MPLLHSRSSHGDGMAAVKIRRWSFAAILALLAAAMPAFAQTVIDKPQIVAETPCTGASVAGVFTCSETSVPVGALVGACVGVNSGTITPTVTETSQSATVNTGPTKLTSASPSSFLGLYYVNNASGGTYTFSSKASTGTVAQNIIPFYLTGVTTTPYDQNGTANNSTTNSLVYGASTGGSLTDRSEIVVQCAGMQSTPTSIASSANSPAYEIPTNGASLGGAPYMGLEATVMGTTTAIVGGASYNVYAGMFDLGTARVTNVVMATFIGSVQPPGAGSGTPASGTFSAAANTTVTLASTTNNDCNAVTIYRAGQNDAVSLAGWNTAATCNGTTTTDNQTTMIRQFVTGDTSTPLFSWTGAATGSWVSHAYSNLNGCQVDGTASCGNGTGTTTNPAPAQTVGLSDELLSIAANLYSVGQNFILPNPFLANANGSINTALASQGIFAYPITVAGTAPAENIMPSNSSSNLYITSSIPLLGGPTPTITATPSVTPTITATPTPSCHYGSFNDSLGRRRHVNPLCQ